MTDILVWAKNELTVDRNSLTKTSRVLYSNSEAAFKYDSQGSVNISAFYTKYLSAAVFREMLKGCLICVYPMRSWQL